MKYTKKVNKKPDYHNLSIKLNPEEFATLQEYAFDEGLSYTDVVRQCIRQQFGLKKLLQITPPLEVPDYGN